MKRLFFKNLFLLLALTSITSAGTDTLYIVYTANINGMIQNCNCGREPLGGMGRIKSYIDKKRAGSEYVIAIDGGDYFNPYPFIELNEALADVQRLVNYDVILPGDQIFAEGSRFFHKLQQQNGGKWVISNLMDFNQQSKKFNIGSHNVEIFGYLSPQSFSFIPKPENVELLNYEHALTPMRDKGKKNLQIMIVHGPEDEARQIRDSFSWIDLILLAHTQKQMILDSLKTPIVGCGRDGEYIVLIKTYMQNLKWRFKIEFEKMDTTLEEDTSVLSIISKLNRKLKE